MRHFPAELPSLIWMSLGDDRALDLDGKGQSYRYCEIRFIRQSVDTRFFDGSKAPSDQDGMELGQPLTGMSITPDLYNGYIR